MPDDGGDTLNEVLRPDSTSSNTGWSAVGAASIHEALADGDSEYIVAAAAGNTTVVTLSNPTQNINPVSARIVIRARR